MTHASPNVVQNAFRGRDDDVALNSTTFNGGGGLNTNWTQDVDTTFRVRFLVAETNNASANNYSYVVYYNHNSGGWNAVTASSPVQFTSSGQFSDGAATSQVIGSGSFVAGEGDYNGSVTSLTLQNQESEFEYCLTIDSAQVADNDTIQLRVQNGSSALNAYNQSLTVTVNEATPDALTANSISASPSLTTPAIGQVHGLTASSTSAAPSVGTPTLGQEHALTASGISAHPSVGTPTVAEVHSLSANGITAQPSVGTPGIGQEHALAAQNIAAAPSIAAPTIGQTHALSADNVTSQPSVGTPLLSTGGTDALSANGIASAPSIQAPTFGQVHILTATGLTAQPSLTTPTLATIHALAANSLTAASSVGQPAMGQVHIMSSAGIAAAPRAGAPSLGAPGNGPPKGRKKQKGLQVSIGGSLGL